LGLPTSRRFVEAHGGTIEAGVSGELGGALFRVHLPIEARDPAPPAEGKETRAS
jgi:signal transduction histidine kinase